MFVIVQCALQQLAKKDFSSIMKSSETQIGVRQPVYEVWLTPELNSGSFKTKPANDLSGIWNRDMPSKIQRLDH